MRLAAVIALSLSACTTQIIVQAPPTADDESASSEPESESSTGSPAEETSTSTSEEIAETSTSTGGDDPESTGDEESSTSTGGDESSSTGDTSTTSDDSTSTGDESTGTSTGEDASTSDPEPPLKALGEPCELDTECGSGNCIGGGFNTYGSGVPRCSIACEADTPSNCVDAGYPGGLCPGSTRTGVPAPSTSRPLTCFSASRPRST